MTDAHLQSLLQKVREGLAAAAFDGIEHLLMAIERRLYELVQLEEARAEDLDVAVTASVRAVGVEITGGLGRDWFQLQILLPHGDAC